MPGLPIVVKIGGSTLGSHDTSLKDLVALQKEGVDLVVVHGGGDVISQWMQRQGIPPRFVNGLRVTDAPSLEIVVAVLTGVNQQGGGLPDARPGRPGHRHQRRRWRSFWKPASRIRSWGTSGKSNEWTASRYEPSWTQATFPWWPHLPSSARTGRTTPAAPLTSTAIRWPGKLAYALEAQRLIFLTDVPGIMDGSGRVIRRLDRRRANILFRSGVVQGGMVPKLAACLRALERLPVADIVDGRRPGALLECVRGQATGTTIVSENPPRALS